MPHNAEFKATDSNRPQKLKKLRAVTLAEAKENPAYWAVVQPRFIQEAVLSLQYLARKKFRRWSPYQGTPAEFTRMPAKKLQFLYEVDTQDERALNELSAKIKSGEWETLNFEDPDFIRNLYQALRLNKISTDELVTALLLCEYRFEFRSEIEEAKGKYKVTPAQFRKYHFNDDVGPYRPQIITTALPEHLAEFKARLATLPDSEQYYFSMNFSKKREIAFLYDCLQKPSAHGLKIFLDILGKYLERFNPLSVSDEGKYGISAIIKSIKEGKINEASAKQLLAFIEAKETADMVSFVKREHYEFIPERVHALQEMRGADADDRECVYDRDCSTCGLLVYVNLNLYFRSVHEEGFAESKAQIDGHFDLYSKKVAAVKPVIAQKLKKLWEDLADKNKVVANKAHKKLKEFIKEMSSYTRAYVAEYGVYYKDRSSSEFSINILDVEENDPWLAISPDYRANDPQSPLICQILPAMSAYSALSRALHGNDTTRPAFVAGKITTRDIRSRDEQNQMRPVELTHPDLRSTANIHGASPPHDSILTKHDVFHCWRNSSEKYKPFIRYLRTLLEKEKGFDMSKSIWGLSDMDFSGGRVIREKEQFVAVLKGMETRPREYLSEENLTNLTATLERILKSTSNIRNPDMNKVMDKLSVLADLYKQARIGGKCVDPAITQPLIDEIVVVYSNWFKSLGCTVVKVTEASISIITRAHLRHLLEVAGRCINKNGGDRVGRLFWKKLDECDDNLLLLIDLVINREEWTRLLGAACYDYIFSHSPIDLQKNENITAVQSTLTEIVREWSNKQSYMFYLMAYRLRAERDKAVILRQLAQVNLKSMFYWERNSGLYFYPDFSFTQSAVEQITSLELKKRLVEIGAVLAKSPAFSSLDENKAKIFCILAYRLKDHPQVKVLCQALLETDLSKILKFKKSNNRLYFCNPVTGLLTQEGLSTRNEELFARLVAINSIARTFDSCVAREHLAKQAADKLAAEALERIERPKREPLINEIGQKILTTLANEEQRLSTRKADPRSLALVSLQAKVREIMTETRKNCMNPGWQKTYQAQLVAAMDKALINKSLNKYTSWAKKLYIFLLNLTTLLVVPALINLARNKTLFFSFHGKTHDEVQKLRDHEFSQYAPKPPGRCCG